MFNKRYVLPFKTIIPNEVEQQLQREPFSRKLKEYWRLLRREIYLLVSDQKRLERELIPPRTTRILWLAPSIRNIGDAIMVFSGRELLRGQCCLDILLDKKVESLFSTDEVFDQVYTDAGKITTNYDLIILDSVKSISLKVKMKYFRKVPYCHFRGHFDGIEFNPILFSYHRINYLIGAKYSQFQLDALARPSLYLNGGERSDSIPQLVIAVGGEDIKRKYYDDWLDFVEFVVERYPDLKIVLVGSENGAGMAEKIIKKFPQASNFVAQLGLRDTAEIIRNSNYFVGCDGGLMHIASSYNIPGVALFGFFKPQFYLPYNSKLTVLADNVSVKNIPYSKLMQLFSNVLLGGYE